MEMDGGFAAWQDNDLEIESEISTKGAGKKQEPVIA